MRDPKEPRLALRALIAAYCIAATVAQTYTNENLPGVNAYSFAQGAPTASIYTPYGVGFTPGTPLAGAAPGAGGCTGVGGVCAPVAVAGSAIAGYWLTRNGAPYWIKCVFCAATRKGFKCARRAISGVFAPGAPRSAPCVTQRGARQLRGCRAAGIGAAGAGTGCCAAARM
jgi:hypothetical protein